MLFRKRHRPADENRMLPLQPDEGIALRLAQGTGSVDAPRDGGMLQLRRNLGSRPHSL